MVARWSFIGEVVGHDEDTFSSYEFGLELNDLVLHPVEAHVERF